MEGKSPTLQANVLTGSFGGPGIPSIGLPEKEKEESDKGKCTSAASDGRAVLANESGVEPDEPKRPPSLPKAETGLKDNGEPDLCTTKGLARAANTKTFAQDTGLTKDGQADERMKHGQHLGVPKAEIRVADTGKKKEGTSDMRTQLGKQQIEKAKVLKQAIVPVVESSSKSNDSLSAQSTPQKKPPAHTPPSPAPEAAAKLVEAITGAVDEDDVRAMKVAELRTRLKSWGVESSGTKPELQARLRERVGKVEKIHRWTDYAVHPLPPHALGGFTKNEFIAMPLLGFTEKELVAVQHDGLGHVNWNGKQYTPEQWKQKVDEWEILFPHIKDANEKTRWGFTEEERIVMHHDGLGHVNWNGEQYTLEQWKQKVDAWEILFPHIKTKHPNETENVRTTAQRKGRDFCWQKLPQANISSQKCPKKLRNIFRVDMYGNVVAHPDHTSDSALCWFDVDHCFPWCRGGRSVKENFAAVQWDANRRVKSDKLIQTLHKDKMSCGLQLEQFEVLMEHVKNQSGRSRKKKADFDKVKYWLTTSPKNGEALSDFQGKFSAWKKSQTRSDGKKSGKNLWDFFGNHFDEAAPVAGVAGVHGTSATPVMLELTSIATGALVSSEPAEGSHSFILIRINLRDLSWSQVCPTDPGILQPWIPGTSPGFASKIFSSGFICHGCPDTSPPSNSAGTCPAACSEKCDKMLSPAFSV
jgi:hypothetical protein